MKMSATTMTPHPEMLAWDSEFWGIKVARAYGTDGLSEWADANTVGLMCLLIDADRPDEAQKAEEQGFRLMDVRVKLAMPTLKVANTGLEPATTDDIEWLTNLARQSHRITRFYADPTLPDEQCDDLYARWIRQSVTGWANETLVPHPPVKCGYVTVHVDQLDSTLGLIAVTPEWQRRGVGQKLVYGALDAAARFGAETMSVVTQGRNIAALRLFESCGFRTVNTSLWYHKRYAR